MEQTGPLNKADTIGAWADIVIKMWQAKIAEMNVWDTGELYRSLQNSLLTGAGNDVDKVEFSFKLYGIFVDMGTGKGFGAGNSGDLGFTPVRKEKLWYSKIFYREVMRLKEILAQKYSEEAARTVVFELNNKE
jgi:hypothetical protein